MADNTPWGNTKITGNSAGGPITGNSEAEKLRATVRGEGTLYSLAINISDPYAFANLGAPKLDSLRYSSTLPAAIASKISDYEYLQIMLRNSGKSKGTGPLNSIDMKDITAFQSVLKSSYLEGIPWFTWLPNNIKYGEKAAGPKAPSFNPIYSKEISSALKLIDSTDAESILSDTYFKTFNQYPSSSLVSSFKTAYSQEAKRQNSTVTSESTVTYAPVLDSKGKASYNKDGTPKMKATTKSSQNVSGQGFTEKEQQDFLAKYIVNNSPEGAFDAATIGGAAKSYYDLLTQSHNMNYEDAPNIATLAPVIKSLLSATDQGVIDTITKKYQSDIRTRVANKFMSVSDYVKSGGDAKTIIDPLLKSLSANLETNIDEKDKLAIKLLNFQGADGKFRPPNQYEINQATMSDYRYGFTSGAKNQAVDLFQSLKNALG